ncbi:MAG: hypothetical protein ABS939_05045 [Psychrobacillus sp.]
MLLDLSPQVPSSNYSDIEVEIDTVHGVKGKTHTATFYLETYFNKICDLEKIIPILKGTYEKKVAAQKTAQEASKYESTTAIEAL